MSKLIGRGVWKLGPAGSGIACGIDCAIAVIRHNDEEECLDPHLQRKGYFTSEATQFLGSRTQRYEIIDGRYPQEAILLLIESDCNWTNFK